MNEEKNKGGMMSVIAALGANVLVAISKFIGLQYLVRLLC